MFDLTIEKVIDLKIENTTTNTIYDNATSELSTTIRLKKILTSKDLIEKNTKDKKEEQETIEKEKRKVAKKKKVIKKNKKASEKDKRKTTKTRIKEASEKERICKIRIEVKRSIASKSREIQKSKKN